MPARSVCWVMDWTLTLRKLNVCGTLTTEAARFSANMVHFLLSLFTIALCSPPWATKFITRCVITWFCEEKSKKKISKIFGTIIRYLQLTLGNSSLRILKLPLTRAKINFPWIRVLHLPIFVLNNLNPR